MKPTPAQVERINAAFDRLDKDIQNYLKFCHANKSPVKSISVKTFDNGLHSTTRVRYHKTED